MKGIDSIPAPGTIIGLLDSVNVNSVSNKSGFIDDGRVRAIRGLLQASSYRLLKAGKLAIVYVHGEATLDAAGNTRYVLLSCHVDSVYPSHFHKHVENEELVGTFDNSICNAILVGLMLDDVLPPNVIVAFTGDEEHSLKGAVETVKILEKMSHAWRRVEIAIVLDVTAVGYPDHACTVENHVPVYKVKPGNKLGFPAPEAFASYLLANLPGGGRDVPVVPYGEASQDETEIFIDRGVNTLCFCIPIAPVPENRSMEEHEWMHHPSGVLLREISIGGYARALRDLCAGIAGDIVP
nr:M28 family peptidase [Candidatus Sigynarchaeota archaeon]